MNVARKRVAGKETRGNLRELAYLHILAREHNTDSLASALGVSFTTAARVVEELRAGLREDGDELLSVKSGKGWHYEIRRAPKHDWGKDPLLSYVIPKEHIHPPRGKAEDADYDRD